MRFPHFISENTRIEYIPHNACLSLISETDRTVFPENLEWDKELCPSLADLCVQAIAKNFKDKPLLDELPCADRYYLLEILPIDIPLETVVPIVEDEIYWKRRYTDKYGVVNEVKHTGWNWKCLYIERHLRDIIEQAQPQYNDEDYMDDLLNLVNPYIHKLSITQLQAWKPPLTWEQSEIPKTYPNDHINFQPIFKRLENISEIDICFGMKAIEMNFSWQLFKLSVADCNHLGKAILFLKLLRIFRLHRSAVDCDRARALCQNLVAHNFLTTIDLSHCLIGDQGALCLAKVMLSSTTLRKLRLANNKIGHIGAVGLGYAMLQKNCCPLRVLDLRLNPLKHNGLLGILRALVRDAKLEELSLAATLFEDETGMRIANMLKLNSSLRTLDVSSNWFDELASQELLNSLIQNRTVHWLDLRETDIPLQIVEKIKKLLYRNRKGLDDAEEDEEPSVELVEVEETAPLEVVEDKPRPTAEEEED